jgi:asparagine synthase (glutamine-hydrolysing)
MVDTLGDGDERRFVRAVVERTGVRNEMVLDDWLWRDDGHEPPRTEAPTANYPFFARDRACCELIRAGGGRVLLTGQGGDQYLSSLPYYIADDLARWRLRDACDAALEWAVANRRSFWTTLARHGLRPLLPARARLAIAERHLRIPGWVRNDFARTECIAERVPLRLMLDARRGELYRGAVAYETAHYGRYTDLTLYQQLFDLRHPFLYRPLVELGLSLPPRLRTRPRQQKWILREAMRGILPDEVRRRSGKGGIDSRIVWSLARERPRLRELLREPILAELGCIEPRPLREELERASRGDVTRVVPLMCALSLETWLQVRAGLWTVRASASSDDALRSAV